MQFEYSIHSMRGLTAVTTDGVVLKTARAPAVVRTAALLRHLATTGRQPVPLRDLAEALSAPKSSVLSICAALEHEGLIRRHPGSRGYTLDRGVLELASAYLNGMDIVELFYDTVKRLRHASRETVQLAVVSGLNVTYLSCHTGEQLVSLTSGIGRTLSATHTAMGKAVLASLDDNQIRFLLRHHVFGTPTPRSLSSVDELLADLHRVRDNGYAVDDEETTEGVLCYGVACVNASAPEPVAVSLTLLKTRDTPEVRQQLVGDLRVLARFLSNPLEAASGVAL